MIKNETIIGNKLQLPTNDFGLFPRSIYSGAMKLYSVDVATEHATVLLAKKISLQMYRANVHALAITSFTDSVLSKSGNITECFNRNPISTFYFVVIRGRVFILFNFLWQRIKYRTCYSYQFLLNSDAIRLHMITWKNVRFNLSDICTKPDLKWFLLCTNTPIDI